MLSELVMDDAVVQVGEEIAGHNLRPATSHTYLLHVPAICGRT